MPSTGMVKSVCMREREGKNEREREREGDGEFANVLSFALIVNNEKISLMINMKQMRTDCNCLWNK